MSWIGTPGGREAKLACVPEGDPAYAEVHDVDDLPPHVTEEIGQFFEVYKGLDEGSSSTDEGREGRVSAVVARASGSEKVGDVTSAVGGVASTVQGGCSRCDDR